MDTTVLHAGIDGAAGFWIFIAACVLAASWEKSRREAEKHETLRRIMEKTGTIDEVRLKELFKSAPAAETPQSPPGGGYRGLRIGGTIFMFIAAGFAVFFLILGQTGIEAAKTAMHIGLAASCIIAMLGAGLFYSSRFAEPPPERTGDRRPGR